MALPPNLMTLITNDMFFASQKDVHSDSICNTVICSGFLNDKKKFDSYIYELVFGTDTETDEKFNALCLLHDRLIELWKIVELRLRVFRDLHVERGVIVKNIFSTLVKHYMNPDIWKEILHAFIPLEELDEYATTSIIWHVVGNKLYSDTIKGRLHSPVMRTAIQGILDWCYIKLYHGEYLPETFFNLPQIRKTMSNFNPFIKKCVSRRCAKELIDDIASLRSSYLKLKSQRYKSLICFMGNDNKVLRLFLIFSMVNEKYKPLFWFWLNECSKHCGDTATRFFLIQLEFLNEWIRKTTKNKLNSEFISSLVDFYMCVYSEQHIHSLFEYGYTFDSRPLRSDFIKAYARKMIEFSYNEQNDEYVNCMYTNVLVLWSIEDVRELLGFLKKEFVNNLILRLIIKNYPSDYFLYICKDVYTHNTNDRWQKLEKHFGSALTIKQFLKGGRKYVTQHIYRHNNY